MIFWLNYMFLNDLLTFTLWLYFPLNTRFINISALILKNGTHRFCLFCFLHHLNLCEKATQSFPQSQEHSCICEMIIWWKSNTKCYVVLRGKVMFMYFLCQQKTQRNKLHFSSKTDNTSLKKISTVSYKSVTEHQVV